jgi:16S rRNA G527 N7-methylase RsmG
MLPIITNLAQKLTYFENYVAEMRLTNISAIKKKVDNLFSKIDFDYVSG